MKRKHTLAVGAALLAVLIPLAGFSVAHAQSRTTETGQAMQLSELLAGEQTQEMSSGQSRAALPQYFCRITQDNPHMSMSKPVHLYTVNTHLIGKCPAGVVNTVYGTTARRSMVPWIWSGVAKDAATTTRGTARVNLAFKCEAEEVESYMTVGTYTVKRGMPLPYHGRSIRATYAYDLRCRNVINEPKP